MTTLNESPLYKPIPLPYAVANPSRGQEVMEGLLLDQYTNSPNLKEYYMAFIAELDFLFEQTEKVYFGRFIETAVGKQLDIIGEILQQPRSVILPVVYFGFQGATDVDGMADEATPAAGGIFKDEAVGDGVITPLDDLIYRRMLMAKAAILNRDVADITLAYHVITILLNKVPSIFELRDSSSGVGIEPRRVDLKITRNEITLQEVSLILYMTKYFVPTGITFTITQV